MIIEPWVKNSYDYFFGLTFILDGIIARSTISEFKALWLRLDLTAAEAACNLPFIGVGILILTFVSISGILYMVDLTSTAFESLWLTLDLMAWLGLVLMLRRHVSGLSGR